MNLKRVEVIGDDEGEIVEAAKRMSDSYDFVVTRQDNERVEKEPDGLLQYADGKQWRHWPNVSAALVLPSA